MRVTGTTQTDRKTFKRRVLNGIVETMTRKEKWE